MAKLFLMSGAPGSGKSYWATTHLPENSIYISRDKLRFEKIGEKDTYFSKEGDVFREFVRQIEEGLIKYDNVFADATHLNPASRNKLISNLCPTSPIEEINVVFLDTPLEVCLARNAKREGRKYVPEEVIKHMYRTIKLPEKEEGIKKVYIVKENEPIIIKYLV